MIVFAAPETGAHHPQFFLVRGQMRPSPEVPERAERILDALRRARFEIAPARAFDDAAVARVHGRDYLEFLETVWPRWAALPEAGAEVLANVHPNRVKGRHPDHVVGQIGWHCADLAAPIGPNTHRIARAAADVALTAAEHLRNGARAAYALCRPPGHHAYADMAGGFCFLNNAAIAAEHLRQDAARVAVLDIDLHHGNGTQEIFYRRRDVLTASLHVDPSVFYPWFWGYADERGEGEGEGANVNLPLPVGTTQDRWLAALRQAVDAVAAFRPEVVVVAAGVDASIDDPFGGFQVSTEGFRRGGAMIASLGLPCLFVQEGGYLSPSLGENVASLLAGFSDA